MHELGHYFGLDDETMQRSRTATRPLGAARPAGAPRRESRPSPPRSMPWPALAAALSRPSDQAARSARCSSSLDAPAASGTPDGASALPRNALLPAGLSRRARVLELRRPRARDVGTGVERLGSRGARGASRRFRASPAPTLDYPFGFPWRAGSPARCPARGAGSSGPRWRTASGSRRRCHCSSRRRKATPSARAGWAGGDGFEWRRAAAASPISSSSGALRAGAGCRRSARLALREPGPPILWRPRAAGRVAHARAAPRVAALLPRGTALEPERRRISSRRLSGRQPLSTRAPARAGGGADRGGRVAMATRQRELHAFSYPNPDDVLVCRSRAAASGSRSSGSPPEFRLPLEGYYGFLALKNGVPVSYGGGGALFGTLDFAFNVVRVVPPGRVGRTSRRQLLRAYRSVFGMRDRRGRSLPARATRTPRRFAPARSTSIIDSGSARAIRPSSDSLADEQAKIVADPAYRSPHPVLEAARSRPRSFLTLPGGRRRPSAASRARRRVSAAGRARHRSPLTPATGRRAVRVRGRARRRALWASDGARRGRRASGARSSACRSCFCAHPGSCGVVRSPSGGRSWPSCGARLPPASEMATRRLDGHRRLRRARISLAHSPPYHCLAVLARPVSFRLTGIFSISYCFSRC